MKIGVVNLFKGTSGYMYEGSGINHGKAFLSVGT